MLNKNWKSNFFIFIILTIFIFAGISIYEYIRYGDFFASTERYRELYKIAKDYQEKDNFKEAYYAYSKISPRYSAYEAVLFHQAQCAAFIEDEKTAIKKFKTIVKKYSKSPLAPQASYKLGQAYLRVNDKESAEVVFKDIIKDYPKTDYAIAAYYYLGMLYKKKDIDLSLKCWKKYIGISPRGRFAPSCIEEILLTGKPLTEPEKLNIAISYYFAEKYKEALSLLKEVPLEKSWYYKAKTYEKIGHKRSSLSVLKEGIKKHSDSVSKNKLWDAMQLYVNLHPSSNLRNWDDLTRITDGKRHQAEDLAIFRKAELMSEKKAKPLYEKIVTKYSDGDFASESLWNIFWQDFSAKRYYEAFKTGKKHIKSYPDKKAAPKMLFWMGKLSERLGRRQSAKAYYNKVLDKFPDNYYSFRANGRLIAMKSGKDPGWGTDKSFYMDKIYYKPSVPYSYNEIEKQFGKLVAELITVEDYELILSLPNKDSFIESWIKYKEGLKSKSIVIARNEMNKLKDKPSVDDKRWQLIYPLYFVDSVNNYAKANDLDPLIALSLMREESYFNPNAISSSNARGLMQLLPHTAKDIARWKNLGKVNSTSLFHPDTNIKLGTAYLKYAKDKLDNQTLFAVAGYNGGPGAVEKWLKKIPSNDLDEFIENIPYDQTRNYIKKVYGTYWNYNRIYKSK